MYRYLFILVLIFKITSINCQIRVLDNDLKLEPYTVKVYDNRPSENSLKIRNKRDCRKYFGKHIQIRKGYNEFPRGEGGKETVKYFEYLYAGGAQVSFEKKFLRMNVISIVFFISDSLRLGKTCIAIDSNYFPCTKEDIILSYGNKRESYGDDNCGNSIENYYIFNESKDSFFCYRILFRFDNNNSLESFEVIPYENSFIWITPK